LRKSYRVIFDTLDEGAIDGALKSFTEDMSSLRKNLREDIQLLTKEKGAVNGLRGKKYQLTRVCNRYLVAIDTIIRGSHEIIAMCDDADDAVKARSALHHPNETRGTGNRLE